MKGWVYAGVALGSTAIFAAVCLFASSSDIAAARFAWVPGKKYTYRLEYHSEGETTALSLAHGNLDNPQPQQIQTAYHGTMEQLLVADHGRNFDVFVRMRQDGSGEAVNCLMKVTALGRVEQLVFEPSSTAMARQLVRSILAVVQVQWPGRQVTTWELQEKDINGPVRATYRSAGAVDDILSFTKEPGADKPASGLETKRSGQLKGAFSVGRHQLMDLAGRLESEFWSGRRHLGAETTTVTLRLASVEDASAADTAGMHADCFAQGMKSNLDGRDELERQRLARLREIVSGVTLRGVMEQYAKEPNSTSDVLRRLSQQLEAYLVLEPEQAARECVAILTTLDPRSASFSSVAAALTTVGNDASQRALRQAMEQMLGQGSALKRLVPHLAMVRHPDEASEDLLRKIATKTNDRNVASTAQLGLGAMGRNLLATERSRAEHIFDEAHAALVGGADADLYLHVLGNIGHPQQVHVVQPLLNQGDATLREQALASLRFVDSDEAQEMLISAAAGDPDTRARVRAVESLGYQKANDKLVSFYIEQLQRERSVPVLREVLRNLAGLLQTSAEAREAFSAFLQECGHADLCSFARGLWSTAS